MKIIFFYFFKNIFYIRISKQSKNIKKIFLTKIKFKLTQNLPRINHNAKNMMWVQKQLKYYINLEMFGIMKTIEKPYLCSLLFRTV
jgi:hypothetical protein